MARYLKPKVRITGRLDTILPGLTKKYRTTRPGQHGVDKEKSLRKKKTRTEYAIRLAEKQKIRFNYGLGEKQTLNYVKKAKKTKGKTGTILLQLLEMRLDNLVFRLNLAPTIAAARQLVNHGHVTVNKKAVSIPSYTCESGDVLSIKDNKTSKQLVEKNLKMRNSIINKLAPKFRRNWQVPTSHLSFNRKTLTAKILRVVDRGNVPLTLIQPEPLKERLVIEYYSRNI